MFGKIGEYYGMMKAAMSAKKEMGKLMEKKEGWKTSEFWLSLLSIGLSLFFAFKSMLDPKWAMLVVMGVTIAYQIARTIAKATPSTKDDEFVAKLGALLEKFGIKKDDEIKSMPGEQPAAEQPQK